LHPEWESFQRIFGVMGMMPVLVLSRLRVVVECPAIYRNGAWNISSQSNIPMVLDLLNVYNGDI
jgi:hypothetical protein